LRRNSGCAQSQPNALADMQKTRTRERSSPSSSFAGMLPPDLSSQYHPDLMPGRGNGARFAQGLEGVAGFEPSRHGLVVSLLKHANGAQLALRHGHPSAVVQFPEALDSILISGGGFIQAAQSPQAIAGFRNGDGGHALGLGNSRVGEFLKPALRLGNRRQGGFGGASLFQHPAEPEMRLGGIVRRLRIGRLAGGKTALEEPRGCLVRGWQVAGLQKPVDCRGLVQESGMAPFAQLLRRLFADARGQGQRPGGSPRSRRRFCDSRRRASLEGIRRTSGGSSRS